MKVLSATQVRFLDRETIRLEPVTSIDLMERAATRCAEWLLAHYPGAGFSIFCGPGNNGGDGLAIARLLLAQGCNVTTYIPSTDRASADFMTNLERLKHVKADVRNIPSGLLPDLANDVIVDAIFGSGLNRAIGPPHDKLIESINSLANTVVAIDIPSGVSADTISEGPKIKADHTLSFEVPKLAFFAPENGSSIGEWHLLTIDLNKDAYTQITTPWHFLTRSDARQLLRPRKKFDHKGTFGHALLVVGSFGKVGAAILSATAALRSGLGLLTVHVPRKAYEIMQITVPEAMILTDRHDQFFSGLEDAPVYASIGIGCGLGSNSCSSAGIADLMRHVDQPLVIDADGLNLISQEPALLDQVPPQSILTPHLKEFERLFGATENHFERLALQKKKAQEHQVIIVLKGAHSAVALPDGNTFFNSTGNPGMATAGSGDVLTGLLTGLLAQGYSPEHTALLGVYIHGLAGDLAADTMGQSAVVASDIVAHIGQAFLKLEQL